MRKALYAFSGDPITYGHIDVVSRTASAFDEVIVGIGVNPDKTYMFTLEERTEMAKRALNHLDNVKVMPVSGLLVDFAYEHKISVIVKGVRNSEDFNYENILHQCGVTQKLGIDTFILIARPELAHVSSSAVKSLQKEQGSIVGYVPLHVKQKLEEKMMSQYIIGITGEPGSGKSYISEKFVELGKKAGIEVHNIELDLIGHEITNNLEEPVYKDVRAQIAKIFGKEVQRIDGSIDRKALGEIVFNAPEKLEILDKIMFTPLMVRLRREIYGKKGLIVFNAALIAETGLSYICNNNVILINVNEKVKTERLTKRNLSDEQIKRRLSSQYSFDKKKEALENKIRENNNGKLWIYDNSDETNDDKIAMLFNSIIKEQLIEKKI